MPKNLVGELFCAVFQEVSVSEKVYRKEGGGVRRFSVESFLSHSAEFFVGEPFCDVFQKVFGSEKVYG